MPLASRSATSDSRSVTSKWARVCSVTVEGRLKIESSLLCPHLKRMEAGFSQRKVNPSVSP
jgi:hypothetical protein